MISYDNDAVLILGQLRCRIYDISFRAISLEAPAIVRPTIPTITSRVFDTDREDKCVFHSTHSFPQVIQIT